MGLDKAMLELNVNARSPGAITTALKKVKEMTATETIAKESPVHLVLDPGVYRETVRYNISNPLVMESAAGTKAEDCVLQVDNCEAYNRGQQKRAVFFIGSNATSVTLKNFTICNSHQKGGSLLYSPANCAEALVWSNVSGTLFCENMRIEGRQNALFVKGFSWFLNSHFVGDVDFISGEPDTSLFENCIIEAIEDNRGESYISFAVNSSTLAHKSGFVFSDCSFVATGRKAGSVFACRTEGKGKPSSKKNWDSAAFVNCTFSDVYNADFLFDDHMNLEVFPRGNATCGIREYGSKTASSTGELSPAEIRRNVKIYTLTEDDYFKGYASRYLILHDTPFAQTLR